LIKGSRLIKEGKKERRKEKSETDYIETGGDPSNDSMTNFRSENVN
jgi:hypothetical protein